MVGRVRAVLNRSDSAMLTTLHGFVFDGAFSLILMGVLAGNFMRSCMILLKSKRTSTVAFHQTLENTVMQLIVRSVPCTGLTGWRKYFQFRKGPVIMECIRCKLLRARSSVG